MTKLSYHNTEMKVALKRVLWATKCFYVRSNSSRGEQTDRQTDRQTNSAKTPVQTHWALTAAAAGTGNVISREPTHLITVILNTNTIFDFVTSFGESVCVCVCVCVCVGVLCLECVVGCVCVCVLVCCVWSV